MPPNRLMKTLAHIILAALVLVGVSLLFLAARGFTTTRPIQDMVQFWAAAKLVRQNPYSVTLVPPLEKSVGAPLTSSADPHFVTRNPPWSLPFYLPLALLSYPNAYAAWTIFTLCVIVACSRIGWHIYSPHPSLIPLFLCLFFGPTLGLLLLGQVSMLVLLGITLFLALIERHRDKVAGSALLLVAIKPHISFLFLLSILLWSINSKRWAVLWCGTLAVIVSSSLMMVINPHIFTFYFEHMRVVATNDRLFPNLGGMLYSLTNIPDMALVPELVGIAWLIGYYWLHRTTWQWNREGLLVLVVSLLCSYYSYPYDEVILLPALLACAATGNKMVFAVGFLLTNSGYAIYMSRIGATLGLGPIFLWWTASAWFVIYLGSRPGRQHETAAGLSLDGGSV